MPKTSEVDRLFTLALEDFTRARNALASQLAKDGRKDEGARVRAVAKPSVSAWAVNQLHWRHRKDLEALRDIGERLRKAQTAHGDLRPLLAARRDAVARLARHAAVILREAGHTPSPETLRRVTTTLDALAAYGTSKHGPSAGTLTADVDAPGFEALAGLVGRSPARGVLRVVPDRRPADETRRGAAQRRARQVEARRAFQRAEAGLGKARRAESSAKAALDEATARAHAGARDKEAKETAYAHAARAVASAERELERARADAARTRSG